mmetsp:Transcript_92221/g.177818  ORF Transcript_92221/g.177818 Transcript_92221/m.177818 type:complete len:124 (-) Transcript_92221:8-379(-)
MLALCLYLACARRRPLTSLDAIQTLSFAGNAARSNSRHFEDAMAQWPHAFNFRIKLFCSMSLLVQPLPLLLMPLGVTLTVAALSPSCSGRTPAFFGQYLGTGFWPLPYLLVCGQEQKRRHSAC